MMTSRVIVTMDLKEQNLCNTHTHTIYCSGASGCERGFPQCEHLILGLINLRLCDNCDVF